MKLMNADKVIEDINTMLVEVKKHPDVVDVKDENGKVIEFSFKTKVNRSKEKDGSFNIVIDIHRDGIKEWKCIAVYFAEHTHGITTLVVDGGSHNIIFENSTMDSPNTLLAYLPDIVVSDVKYLTKCKVKPKTFTKKNINTSGKNFTGRRKDQVSRNGSSYRSNRNGSGSQGKYTKRTGSATYNKNSSTYKNYTKKEY